MRKTSILVITFFVLTISSFSQKMSIGFIYPAGGQMGTTFEIEVGGLNVAQATEVFVSGKGVKAEILKPTEKNKKPVRKKFDDQSSPQLADRLKIQVTIAKNATPGLRDFRLQSSKGVSNKLTFEVGQYPDIREQEKSSLQKPNVVSQLPATLCGQIMPGERDYFSFEAEKGTTLVAAAKARVFVPYIADAVPGWFQAVITLRNSKGREVAFNDDFRTSVDPVIIYEIPENDTYTLMIHDAIFRGREDFNYRIEVGEIPYIQSIYPAVGQQSKSEILHINAINVNKTQVKFKPTFEGKGFFTINGKNDFVSNPVPFYSVDKTKILRNYSNQLILDNTTVIFDSLTEKSKSRTYFVDLARNESFVAEITARKIGSLLDARLALYDATGKKVAEDDDTEDAKEGLMTHHADPKLKYKAIAAGKYKLVVEDILQGSGVDYFYILERKPATSDFEVFVSPANITIPKGGTATFMLDIVSPDKKYPRLDLELQGLPRGFKTSNMEVRGNKWEVSISAPEKAKEQKLELKVLARNKTNGNNETIEVQQAVAADNMMQAFYYMHHIPAVNFVAEIIEQAPYSLHFEPEIERNLQKSIFVSPNDTVVIFKVELRRKADFNETVTLQLGRKTKQIVLDPVEFKPGETEKTIYIKLNLKDVAKFKGMQRPISIVGTVSGQIDKRGKRTFENALYRETTPIIMLELKN
jgi:hypothetical protein